MILCANCKINLGLYVESKRPDGYHNISTVMMPIFGLYDVVEVLSDDSTDKISFSSSGIPIDCPPQDNLCVKACVNIKELFPDIVKGVNIHLHKRVPFGAGLGSGSSDAVAVLKALNEVFMLNMSSQEMIQQALKLGSDTAFFVPNEPLLCRGRGEEFTPVPDLDVKGYHITIVKPTIGVKTADAYRDITPMAGREPLDKIILSNPYSWRNTLVNDFQKGVFAKNPQLALILQELYNAGALYASMSGSGSALYAISCQPLHLGKAFKECFIFNGML